MSEILLVGRGAARELTVQYITRISTGMRITFRQVRKNSPSLMVH